jgi:hypothetical protein
MWFSISMDFKRIHGRALLLAIEKVCEMLGGCGDSIGVRQFDHSTENSEEPSESHQILGATCGSLKQAGLRSPAGSRRARIFEGQQLRCAPFLGESDRGFTGLRRVVCVLDSSVLLKNG